MSTTIQTRQDRFAAIRERTSAWIAVSDTKAATLLAICGALLAVTSFGIPARDKCSPVVWLTFVVFVMCDSIAILAALAALWPRMARRSILARADATPTLEQSLMFFYELGEMRLSEFVAHVEGTSETEERADAQEQALILCRIARDKMRSIRVSTVFLGIALFGLSVFIVSSIMQH